MPRLSISTWSLHALLGRAWYDEHNGGRLVNRSEESDSGPATMTLMDVPAEIKARGIGTLEICHFHLPSVETGALEALRAELERCDVELFSILVDAGDLTHPDRGTREKGVGIIRRWLTRAAACGASHVRVIAGDQDADEETLDISARMLRELGAAAAGIGLRLLTENFKRLTRRPADLLHIIDACDGTVGLCADFGNYPVESRTEDLAAILPRAEAVHAKADYAENGDMKAGDFAACLALVKGSGFDGPISLIHQESSDSWAGIQTLKEAVEQSL